MFGTKKYLESNFNSSFEISLERRFHNDDVIEAENLYPFKENLTSEDFLRWFGYFDLINA